MLFQGNGRERKTEVSDSNRQIPCFWEKPLIKAQKRNCLKSSSTDIGIFELWKNIGKHQSSG